MPSALYLARIAAALGADARRFDIDLVSECDSTNSRLLERAEAGAPSGSVLLAERQTAGRGRRGRTWISAAGDSLTFSLFWRFAPGTLPAGLSLAVGVAVANAIAKVGSGGTAPVIPIRLKWPNDILLDDRKLGGILVELLPGCPHAAVIGIGINRHLPAAMPDELRASATALPTGIDPHALLAAMLGELRSVLETFASAGFAALRPEWQRLHAYQNAPVRLLADFTAPRDGICRGVDVDGALLFESSGTVERILSGEISLRSAT